MNEYLLLVPQRAFQQPLQYRGSQKKVDPFKFKLAITYCINLNALILLCYGA